MGYDSLLVYWLPHAKCTLFPFQIAAWSLFINNRLSCPPLVAEWFLKCIWSPSPVILSWISLKWVRLRHQAWTHSFSHFPRSLCCVPQLLLLKMGSLKEKGFLRYGKQCWRQSELVIFASWPSVMYWCRAPLNIGSVCQSQVMANDPQPVYRLWLKINDVFVS